MNEEVLDPATQKVRLTDSMLGAIADAQKKGDPKECDNCGVRSYEC